jgi:hypothetical protein
MVGKPEGKRPTGSRRDNSRRHLLEIEGSVMDIWLRWRPLEGSCEHGKMFGNS